MQRYLLNSTFNNQFINKIFNNTIFNQCIEKRFYSTDENATNFRSSRKGLRESLSSSSSSSSPSRVVNKYTNRNNNYRDRDRDGDRVRDRDSNKSYSKDNRTSRNSSSYRSTTSMEEYDNENSSTSKIGSKFSWKDDNVNRDNDRNDRNDRYDNRNNYRNNRDTDGNSSRYNESRDPTQKSQSFKKREKSEVVLDNDQFVKSSEDGGNEEMNITGFRSVLSCFLNRDSKDLKRLYISQSLYEKNKGELKDIVKYFSESRKPYRIFQDDDQQLEKVSQSKHHEGICLVVRPKEILGVEDAIDREFQRTKTNVTPTKSHSLMAAKTSRENSDSSSFGRPIVVLLDNVENPHNIGAIIRSCASFGVKTVFAYNEFGLSSGGRINPHSTSSFRASRGAMEHVAVVPIDVRSDAINMLKKFAAQGWQVISTSGNNSSESGDTRLTSPVPLYSDKAVKMLGTSPLVIVFGSESAGISKGIVKLSNNTLVIPSTGLVDCLNVSQALSIVLAECWRIQGRTLQDQRLGAPDLKTQIKNRRMENLEVTPELLGISREDIYKDLEDNSDEVLADEEDIELQEDLKDYDEMKRNSKNKRKY